eukprot:RCo002663
MARPPVRPVRQQKILRQGWAVYSVQDQIFEIPERYELLGCIGKGAFGTVVSARSREGRVAIKKISIREDNILEVKRLVREVCLLRHFDHENIIGLKDILEPSYEGKFEEIYIVSDLMDTDLHQIIRSSQPLSGEHIQFFLYQLLRGLKPIHCARVLHRDLVIKLRCCHSKPFRYYLNPKLLSSVLNTRARKRWAQANGKAGGTFVCISLGSM